MKKVVLVLIIMLCLASFTFAQTNVTPGIGTLSAAIRAAASGDVLQLQSGGVYMEGDSSAFAYLYKAITIQVDPSATERPILIPTDTSDVVDYFFEMRNGSSLTLKGIEFIGITGDATAKSLMYFEGDDDPANAVVDSVQVIDCVVHDFTDNLFHGFKSAEKGLVITSIVIENSVFYNGKTFLRLKYPSLGALSITNSTVYGMVSYGVFMGAEDDRGTAITPVATIDHCTFNGLDPFIEAVNMENQWTVSNCIFSNSLDPDNVGLDWDEPKSDPIVTISYTSLWEAGATKSNTEPFWPGYVMTNVVEVDPQYTDPDNGDFTIAAGNELLIAAEGGGAIGDPRWADNATGVKEEGIIPKEFTLSQNYPNPFNPVTTIEFYIDKRADVQLQIYDLSGAFVESLMDRNLNVGRYLVEWDASIYPSGLYFCRLTANGKSKTRKMMLMQ